MAKVTKKKSVKAASSKLSPTRFAHPFFNPAAPENKDVMRSAGSRLTDHIKTKLEPIPVPKRNAPMTLDDIIGKNGVDAIAQSGSITFHAVGDTGEIKGNWQERVAEVMAKDYDTSKPEKSPAFFLHLGDVDYYDNTDNGYHAQFYVPYKNYPGKIIAIPGNHDGELFKWDGSRVGQKKTLEAFIRNFCQAKPGIPPAAGTIYREMVSQPGVYWVLNSPFVDIIGLYSNMGENPGYISGPAPVGQKQKTWLTKTLTDIANKRANEKKALIIAVHHPPFSTGAHGSSSEMLKDIIDSCNKAKIMPDAVLAAHSHSYQRYTGFISFGGKQVQIPFVVAGCGGRTIQKVAAPYGKKGDHSFDQAFSRYGYLKINVTKTRLKVDFISVDENASQLADSITVDL